LELPVGDESFTVEFEVKRLLPAASVKGVAENWDINFKSFSLDSLVRLSPGDYHNASNLPVGDTPLISCGDANNGISAFISAPRKHIYQGKLTIAFNDMNTLTTKFHPCDFAAKDDVVVCTPREPLRLSTLVFIQVMMDRERWRHSYYRKCFMDKLKRQGVLLPQMNSGIDEDTIKVIMNSTTYWNFLCNRLAA
jgi:hypothetical protein